MDEKEVVKLYLEGYSITYLAKNKFHCRTSAISEILKKNNITIRRGNKKNLNPDIEKKICDRYTAGGVSITSLAKEFSYSTYLIKNILEKNHIEIHKFRPLNYNLKDDYFEIIDSEAKAYYLGFIFSDGSVSERTLQIEIHEKDIDILDKLKKELNSNATISRRNNRQTVTLSIVSRKMVEDLNRYGIVKNKTYVTKGLPNIPRQYVKDFLRGLLDGDGWLSLDKNGRWHMGFVSHYKETCEDFKRYCNLLIKNKITSNINPFGNSYIFQSAHQEIVKELLSILYKDSNFYLTRKYLKAAQIFEYKNDEDIV